MMKSEEPLLHMQREQRHGLQHRPWPDVRAAAGLQGRLPAIRRPTRQACMEGRSSDPGALRARSQRCWAGEPQRTLQSCSASEQTSARAAGRTEERMRSYLPRQLQRNWPPFSPLFFAVGWITLDFRFSSCAFSREVR